MNLKDIILNEINQSQNKILYDSIYVKYLEYSKIIQTGDLPVQWLRLCFQEGRYRFDL